ncbi:piggyBac transposable element-derived protein 3-like [Harmonia axyridis]|uniref:piggyBac transposable element-derived protein 3-like n=1 Tax=Harmonia axyridis TaxID=115357 RepID=UPI001E2790D9|nr:piggyBac transposable element-derived protein 3-like [Harmonia axyridis]
MDPKFVRGFSLKEALDIVYNDEEDSNGVCDIYISPPEPNVLTDEDSGDEEGGEMDNLSRGQLSTAAEIRLSDNSRITGFEDVSNEEGSEGDNSLLESEVSQIEKCGPSTSSNKSTKKTNSTKKPQKKVKETLKRTWIEGDLLKTTAVFPQPDYTNFIGKSPTDLFELFFDDDIVRMLVEESNKYALFLNHPDPKIESDEMKCFIGILILTGYNSLPGKCFYWDSESDMGNQLVKEAMRRDRFRQIMRFLHCADNTKPNYKDKMWKLRPLIEKLQKNYLKYFKPTENMSYDECMVKYYGRHSCKQFIRGKPIRFGYKVWSLNAENGYLINFDIYQGSNPKSVTEYDNKFGKATSPLLIMLDSLPDRNLRYQIYTDNLFTSFNLLTELKQRGYGVTGTVRENRVPKDCPITSKLDMKKKKRGSIESKISKDEGVILVRWTDNAPVTMASTSYGIEPTSLVKRYSQSEKKIIQIPQPRLINAYNKYMGGTDRMDEDIARHRIGIRSKKWYWPLLTWLIDTALHNAWIQYKSAGNSITNLNFRREIVKVYLNRFKTAPKRYGRPTTSRNSVSMNRISDDIRYDHKDHLVVPVPNNKRRRCAGEGCSSVGRTQCNKCDLGLCVECFYIFHIE